MAEKKSIKFEIATPERTLLKEDIFQATIPTQSGEITVLPDHIPLVSIIKPGVLEIKTSDGETEIISISGGFVEVLQGKIVILADTAERAHEIDESRIIAARQRAEDAKAEALAHPSEGYDLSAVAAKLEVEMARERALHKWRRLKNINPGK